MFRIITLSLLYANLCRFFCLSFYVHNQCIIYFYRARCTILAFLFPGHTIFIGCILCLFFTARLVSIKWWCMDLISEICYFRLILSQFNMCISSTHHKWQGAMHKVYNAKKVIFDHPHSIQWYITELPTYPAGSTPSRGAIKSTGSTQPYIPPG